MALIFCDSFDHYAHGATASTRKWTDSRNGVLSLTTGRFGSAWDGFESRWSRKDFTGGTDVTWTWGGACLFRGGDNREFVNFSEIGNGPHVSLWFDYSINTLKLQRSILGGTVLGSYGFSPTAGVYYYIEMRATCDNATGAVEVRIDDVPVITVTGVDTRNGGTGVFNQLILGAGNQDGSEPAVNIDDLYLLNDVDSGVPGTPNDDFLGDVRVEALYPNGNGNSSQFSGSDGNSVNNYQLVDETDPNGDVDYVESATLTNKDTYAFSNLTPTTGTVYGVQILPYIRKTDAGTRKFQSITRLAGTEVNSADNTLSTTYQYFPEIREADPAGAQWTVSTINSAEFGVEVTA